MKLKYTYILPTVFLVFFLAGVFLDFGYLDVELIPSSLLRALFYCDFFITLPIDFLLSLLHITINNTYPYNYSIGGTIYFFIYVMLGLIIDIGRASVWLFTTREKSIKFKN